MDEEIQRYLRESAPGHLLFGGARMALLDIAGGFWGLRRQLEALIGRRLADSVLQQAGANGGASFAQGFAPDVAPGEELEALRDCLSAYQAAGFGRFCVEDAEWPLGRILIRGEDTFEAWMFRRHGVEAEGPVCAYTAGVLVGFINVLAGRRDVVCVERACQAQGGDTCVFELLPAPDAQGAPAVAVSPDPALGRRLNLLELLFHRMPMGIAIIDRDFKIRRYNATWEDFSAKYGPPSGAPLAPGVGYFEHLPGTEPVALPLFRRVLAGETIRENAVRLESEGIVTYWDIVLSPLVEDGEVVGILNVAVDATDRVRAEEALRESEAKFRLLFERSPDAMLLLDGERFIDCNRAALEMLGCSNKEEFLSLSIYDISPERQPDGRPSVEKARELLDRAYKEGSLRFEWIHRRLDDGREFPVEVLLTAISLRGRRILHVSWRDISDRKRAEEALQRAYHTLEQRVEERTWELRTLLEVAKAASGSLELPQVLRRVARGLASAVGVRHCGIYLVDEERGLLVPAEGANPEALGPGVSTAFRARPLDPARDPFTREVLEKKAPVVCQDAAADPRTDKEVVRLLGLKSILAVPFVVKGRVVAVAMLATFDEPYAFTEEQIELAQGIAGTVALAIENARLYGQVREKAAFEERARLARELHDSVTQSLYSMTLFAEAARRQADAGKLDTVREHLEELGEAARQALKEMRLLVYQLRPAALEREGLVGALRARLEAVERRAGVEAALTVEGEGELPREVEEGLYRIAQEALNNALKHAHAASVVVTLRLGEDCVELEVRDDGRGFVPGDATAGMGLANMRERARTLGGTVEIASAPGKGTAVRVRVPTR
ncbi:PAS domain S-box protein [Candidatus Bipolaricaulota sp. J31]